MSYPYFAATLPSLSFDGAPSLTEAEFRDRCHQHLKAADFAALTALYDGGVTNQAFVLKWRDCDTEIRNAVVHLRATKLGTSADASKWLRECKSLQPSTQNAVTAAFQEPNPLRRERALEQLRWNLAGDLAGFDTFSAAAIFAYAIRLGIVSRRAAENTEKGSDRLRNMMKAQAPSAE